MSDAPAVMASSKVFWMNLTMGASSISALEVSGCSDLATSSMNSRLRSISSSTILLNVSRLESEAFWMNAPSLSSSTMTGSMASPVLNLISSIPCRFSGLDVAMNSLFPLLCRAATLCFCISLMSMSEAGSVSWETESRSSRGKPKVWEENMAISFVSIRLLFTSSDTKLPPLAAAASSNTLASFSDNLFCWTSARARLLFSWIVMFLLSHMFAVHFRSFIPFGEYPRHFDKSALSLHYFHGVVRYFKAGAGFGDVLEIFEYQPVQGFRPIQW